MDATEHTDSGGYHTTDGHEKISNLPGRVAKYLLGRLLLGPTVFVWLRFFVFYWEKGHSLVGLVAQLFQPTQNLIEMVENNIVGVR